jgi:hypothetical protein
MNEDRNPEGLSFSDLVRLAQKSGRCDFRSAASQLTRDQEAMIAGLWSQTVSEHPSIFGRLAYLASLRQGGGNGYTHYGLNVLLGDKAVTVIRGLHLREFWGWRDLSLVRKKEDLELFFSSAPGHRRQVVETWRKVSPRLRNLVPPGVPNAEVNLFAAEFQLIFEMVRSAYSESGSPSRNPWLLH